MITHIIPLYLYLTLLLLHSFNYSLLNSQSRPNQTQTLVGKAQKVKGIAQKTRETNRV